MMFNSTSTDTDPMLPYEGRFIPSADEMAEELEWASEYDSRAEGILRETFGSGPWSEEAIRRAGRLAEALDQIEFEQYWGYWEVK